MATYRKRLTEKLCEKVRPPKNGMDFYYDTVTRGFYLQVSWTGRSSYYVFYRLKGRQHRRKVGTPGGTSLKDARNTAWRAIQKARDGIDMFADKDDQARLTFKRVANDFIERYAKKQTKHWQLTQQIIERECFPKWESREIGTIKRPDIYNLLDDIVDRGEPVAALNCRARLTKLFSWACDRGYILESPARNIKIEASVTPRERVLSDKELRAIWQACDREGYPWGPLVQLLMLTALRRTEAATLQWDYIQDDAIEIPTTKAGKPFVVPMTKQIRATLENVPRFYGPFIFSARDGRAPVKGFDSFKKRLDAESGVSGWTFHDLRRTCATNWAKLRMPKHIISLLLNHHVAGVTDRHYNRFDYLDEKREALQMWEARLMRIVKPEGNVIKLSFE